MAHKLLLADDSVTIQRVIELTFADEDVEVTTVGDGQLAIERLDTDPPDIILADVDMPKRDGYEVAAYVKSRPQLAHIPVVLLTGAFEPIDQARATAAGSSDVLAKPFEPQMVINRVKELLGKKRDEVGSDGSQEADFAAGAQPPASGLQPSKQSADNSQPVSLDDYFDQLDAAFSSMQPAAPPSDGTDEVDWTAQSAATDTPAPTAPAALPTTLIVEPSSAPPFVPEPVAAPKPVTVVSTFTTPKPIAPVAPAAPVAPVAPSAPIAPIAPIEPIAPTVSAARMPVTSTYAATPPIAPVAPSAPVAPAAPIAPNASVAPIAPTAPIAPPAPIAPIAPTAPPAPSATVSPKPNPFANLSAAKAEAAARPAAPVITDELIEQIVARVLERMTDRVVRETVSEIVSQTAERLVQEEIERIRSSS